MLPQERTLQRSVTAKPVQPGFPTKPAGQPSHYETPGYPAETYWPTASLTWSGFACQPSDSWLSGWIARSRRHADTVRGPTRHWSIRLLRTPIQLAGYRQPSTSLAFLQHWTLAPRLHRRSPDCPSGCPWQPRPQSSLHPQSPQATFPVASFAERFSRPFGSPKVIGQLGHFASALPCKCSYARVDDCQTHLPTISLNRR